jgi:hypothetical protein
MRTLTVFLLLCSPALGELIDFTNFGNRYQVFPTITEGRPLEGPWIWWEDPIHSPVPWWPMFGSEINFMDEITSTVVGPIDLGDGLAGFELETTTTIQALEEGAIVGTMVLKTTEPQTFTIDTNPFRITVLEAAGMGLVRTWSGGADGPDLISYFVEAETGVFADDDFLFTGEQLIAHNSVLSFPLEAGVMPTDSLKAALASPETSLLGETGSWGWTGGYEAVPEPHGKWLIPAFLIMGAWLAITRVKHCERH